jgi:CRISPR-associated protein Cas5h
MQSGLDDYASGGPPDRCLSVTIAGPWGHFRRVDGNTIKSTYRLPPRTTVAGLLAAVAGYSRDGYYDIFDTDRSGIAMQPVPSPHHDGDDEGGLGGVPRTMNLPGNSLTTSNEGMKSVNARGKVSIRYPDPTEDRQRINYEMLVNPAYRVDVYLSDDDAYDRLHNQLATGRSEYIPSLGLSECLASIQFHGEFTPSTVGSEDTIAVDSAVPDPDAVIPAPDTPHGTERSPADMTTTDRPGEFTGRRTTEFLRWAYSRDGKPLQTRGIEVHNVDGRNVVFS